MGDLSVDRERSRARARKGGGGTGGSGIAGMRMALRQFSVAMSLEHFGSSSASSVTASTSLLISN